MKALYATLIGVVALLMVAHLALAGPPSWDDQINKPSRFKALKEFGDAAVLDKETGLVWEQLPDTNTQAWVDAQGFCNMRNVGNRLGWRLPTIQELASLVDSTQFNPALPSGHPFSVQTSLVETSVYWSATTAVSGAINANAWAVSLLDGTVSSGDKESPFHVWCVRGGQGVDPQ